MTNYRLSILLDTYAGDVDEFVTSALTGLSEGRMGVEEGLALYNKHYAPLADDDEYPIVDFLSFDTEYGLRLYDLDNKNYNALLLGVDDYSVPMINEQIALWKQAYGDPIVLPKTRKDVVILGFELVEILEKRTKL